MRRTGLQRIWPVMQARAMRVLWFTLARRARDQSAELAAQPCVVLAPHPDDETLGCGGLILRKRAAGARVDVIMATDGGATHEGQPCRSMTQGELIALRERETLAACTDLGVAANQVHFLRLPDGALADHTAELETRLAEMLAHLSPREVFVCALADGHRDHIALARAARALLQAGALQGAALWEYPVWFWDFRSWRPMGVTNKRGFVLGLVQMIRHARHLRPAAVSLKGLHVTKRAALGHHRSQLGLLEAEPDWEGLPESFLSFFFREAELFFPVEAAAPDEAQT